MSAVFLDACPRCQADISRRLGLITTRKVDCPNCGRATRVTVQAIRSNWQYNFAAFSGIAIFVGVATAILISPEVATEVAGYWHRLGYIIPGPLLLALISPLPPLIAVFPLALVGRLVGQAIGRRLVDGPDERRTTGGQNDDDPDDLVAKMLARYHLQSTGSGGAPRRRWTTLAIRMATCSAWGAAFFVAAGLAILVWVHQGAGPHVAAQRQAMRAAAESYGPGVLVGSVVLAAFLGGLGWLPGTRRG